MHNRRQRRSCDLSKRHMALFRRRHAMKRLRRFMRRILLIAAILAAYAFGSQVFAQGTAKNAEKKTTTSYPLTDKQKGDYTRLETAEKDGQDALQRAIVSALEIPVSPTTSVQFHAQIREIQL